MKRKVIIGWAINNKTQDADREKFWEFINDSQRNKQIIKLRAEPDKDKQDAMKRLLPGTLDQADGFVDGIRLLENAIPSRIYGCDFDFKDNPHMTDPRKYFTEHILPKKEELHLIEAYISTRGKGLQTKCVLPINASIEQAQRWQATQVGLKEDPACKNQNRVFFLPHKDEILFMDEEAYFGERELEEYTIPIEEETVTVSQVPICINQEKIDEVRAKISHGVKVGKIFDEYVGTEMIPSGQRNNTIFVKGHKLMALGLSTEELVKLFTPITDLPQAELHQALRWQSNYVPSDGRLPVELRRTIQQLREEEGLESGKKMLECRPIPKLVPLFRELASAAPKGFVAPLIFLAIPILGFLATKVRIRYLDGIIHSLAFMAHVVGKMAGGKSTTIKWLTELLLKDIREQDAIGRQLEREYFEACRRCKNDEKKPKEPKPIIREVPFTISVASLLKRLAQAKGMHLISVTDEIDTVRKTNKAGAWSEKTDIYRHAFDNGEYGQDYLSENSFSGIYKVMYNTVSGGTEESTMKFFGPHVMDGLVTRIAFTRTPDDFASEMPRFKELTPKQLAVIEQGVKNLEEAEGEIRIPRTSKAINQWLVEKRKLAMESMSLAIDAFYKRAGVMGYRAAAIAYLLNDYKETTNVIDFGLWVADYVLQQQVAMWGSYIENAEQMETTTPVANLYKELGEEFTREELINLRLMNGMPRNERTNLMRWKKAGMIREVEKNKYVKTTPQTQAKA